MRAGGFEERQTKDLSLDDFLKSFPIPSHYL